MHSTPLYQLNGVFSFVVHTTHSLDQTHCDSHTLLDECAVVCRFHFGESYKDNLWNFNRHKTQCFDYFQFFASLELFPRHRSTRAVAPLHMRVSWILLICFWNLVFRLLSFFFYENCAVFSFMQIWATRVFLSCVWPVSCCLTENRTSQWGLCGGDLTHVG